MVLGKLSLASLALGALSATGGIAGKLVLDSQYQHSVPHQAFQEYIRLNNQIANLSPGNDLSELYSQRSAVASQNAQIIDRGMIDYEDYMGPWNITRNLFIEGMGLITAGLIMGYFSLQKAK